LVEYFDREQVCCHTPGSVCEDAGGDSRFAVVADGFGRLSRLAGAAGGIASGRKERPALWGRQSQFFGRLGRYAFNFLKIKNSLLYGTAS
jgi:hypothetical protein